MPTSAIVYRVYMCFQVVLITCIVMYLFCDGTRSVGALWGSLLRDFKFVMNVVRPGTGWWWVGVDENTAASGYAASKSTVLVDYFSTNAYAPRRPP